MMRYAHLSKLFGESFLAEDSFFRGGGAVSLLQDTSTFIGH